MDPGTPFPSQDLLGFAIERGDGNEIVTGAGTFAIYAAPA
jgi:hypothetical protein